MAKAFVDGLFDDGEYRRQKEQIEFELASLVVPEADITEEVGKLLMDLPRLWAGAMSQERRQLLLTVLDAVNVDTKGEKRVVEVRPKRAFHAVPRVSTLNDSANEAFVSFRKNAPVRGYSD